MAIGSAMLALGTHAPDFELTDTVSGRLVSSGGYAGKKALAVMFVSSQCPYVKHVQQGLADLGRDYAGSDVALVAICSNDPAINPEDAPESLAADAQRLGFTFPLLFDETQEVAKAYSAACTPDFFLFGPDRTLVYRGQFDDSRPSNDVPVTGRDLRAAIDAVLADEPVADNQRPSLGCSIKWRPGNEPG